MKRILLLISLLGFAIQASADPQIGYLAPNFTATDIFGKTFNLINLRGKIVVIESYRSDDCPFCEAHYHNGAMQELQKEMTTNGVIWLLIDFSRQAASNAKDEWTNQQMAVTGYIVGEPGDQIGRMYGLRTAPEAVVLDRYGRLAYEGAFDDFNQVVAKDPAFRATLGGPNIPLRQRLDTRDQVIINLDPRQSRNYVREAVRALRSGKLPAINETKPYGCPIPYNLRY